MLPNKVTRNVNSENRRRDLIFLWPYTNWGGAQVYFFAIMKLAKRDWNIVAVIPTGSRPDLIAFLEELGVTYELAEIRFDARPEASLTGKLRRQFERIRSEVRIYRYLRRYRLRDSVLHIETAPWQSWVLLAALALRGAKTFVTLHNFRPEVSSLRALIWRIRFAIVSRLPGFHIFASNRDTKENLKGWLPEAFREEIRVTYTCVDPVQIVAAGISESERASYRQGLGLRSDEFVVLAVGQFIDRKGRWVFLDAAAKAIQQRRQLRFMWVMPEPISEEDLRIIEGYELRESFVPVLSSSIGSDRLSVLKFFKIADAFALPSFIEGLPIAVLEAMALGIPSISTNVYAIPEAVKDGETGILIEPGNSDELCDAIVRLYDDPDLRSRLSISGSEFVLKNFDEREAAAICIETYKAAF